MSPSSTVHGGQHDSKYVTFELLLHAAFAAYGFWGFMLEPARTRLHFSSSSRKPDAADTWIRGWERPPLLKLVRKAITPDRPSSADLTRVLDEFFAHVKENLNAGVSGPETFRRLLRLISSHFGHGDGNASFNRLDNFEVANGIPFSVFLRAFRVVLSGVTGSEQVPSPSTMSTVLELARRGVMNQYPLGSCPRFTRENWPPWPPRLVRLILYMWSDFRVLATNKTLAISGGKYFSFSPFSGPVFAIACRQSLTE